MPWPLSKCLRISHSDVLLANFCVRRTFFSEAGSCKATDMTVGDREAWTSSNRAPCGRFASRICCESEMGLLLYLGKSECHVMNFGPYLCLLQRKLLFTNTKLLASFVTHFCQILGGCCWYPNCLCVRVEHNDVRHYAGRNNLYRPYEARMATGALAIKTAREYQQSQ